MALQFTHTLLIIESLARRSGSASILSSCILPLLRSAPNESAQRGVLKGQGEFARLWLLALIALEVREQLAHKPTDFTVGNVEGCEASDQIPCAHRWHALLCILHLRRPHHLHLQLFSGGLEDARHTCSSYTLSQKLELQDDISLLQSKRYLIQSRA